MEEKNVNLSPTSIDTQVDQPAATLTRRERRQKAKELEKTRKKHARRLTILSFLISISVYKTIYAVLAATNGVFIPVKWILLMIVLMLGALAQYWHKNFKISIQQAAAAAVIGSAMSLVVIMGIAIAKG